MVLLRIPVFLGTLLVLVFAPFGCGNRKEGAKINPVDNDTTATTSAKASNTFTSLSPDNVEITVSIEKMDASEFRIHYVLTNKGSKPVYRVVPYQVAPHYVLIRPFRLPRDQKDTSKFELPLPGTTKAKDIVVLFGVERTPDNIYFESVDSGSFVELAPGSSVQGTVTVPLPVRFQSYYDRLDEKGEKRAEDDINKMVHSEKGAPCFLAFAYLLHEDCIFMPDGHIAVASDENSRLAFSQPVNVRIK